MAKAPAKAAPAVKAPPKPAPAAKTAKKSGGMAMLLLGLVGGGVVATVGGWLLGGMIAGAAIERLAPAVPPAASVGAPGEPSAKAAGEKAGDAGHPPEGEAAKAETASDDGHGGGHGGSSPVEMLPAITTNLAGPGDTWIRLELALVTHGGEPLSEDEKTQLSDGFLAALRNTPLSAITGPSGMLHLREDLTDTAMLATGEKVTDIRIISMVVE
jgi:flagellar FliL protein